MARALCYLFFALMACALFVLDWNTVSPVGALAISLLAVFVADFLSGVIHVYLDYLPFRRGAGIERVYFYAGPRDSSEYLELKESVFRNCSTVDLASFNFKIHHWKPKAMNRKDYAWHALETIHVSFLALLASFLLPGTAALGAIVLAFCMINTQFIHACIHDTHKSVFWKRVVRMLQRLRIIYSLETHMEHHRHGKANFCLITGWANVLMNPLCALLFQKGVLSEDFWNSLLRPDRARTTDRPDSAD